MESRFRVLFLIVVVATLSGCAATRNLFGPGRDEAPPIAEPPEQVIEPEVERRDIREPAIDTENFEIGAFTGIMSIEDFGTDLVYGVRLAYHVTEGLFVEGTLGRSEGGLTSFEQLSGGARLLSDSDRVYTYYNLNLSYNLLPGEGFVGEGFADRSQESPDVIEEGIDQIDDRIVGRPLAPAKEIQKRFRFVRQVVQHTHVEEATESFDGVEDPEDAVDYLDVFRIGQTFDLGLVVLQGVQRFDYESLNHFTHLWIERRGFLRGHRHAGDRVLWGRETGAPAACLVEEGAPFIDVQ